MLVQGLQRADVWAGDLDQRPALVLRPAPGGVQHRLQLTQLSHSELAPGTAEPLSRSAHSDRRWPGPAATRSPTSGTPGTAATSRSLIRPRSALPRPVGFQNSAAGPDLRFYAARSYSLMRPPRTGRRWIRSWERSATGWSGRGGRRWRLRWGRRPL